MVVLIGAWSVTASAEPALACDCGPLTAGAALTGEGLDAVFVGTVTGEPNRAPTGGFSSAQRVTWEFAVDEVYRGQLSEVIEVKSAISSASCGFERETGLGDRVGLALREEDGAWTAGLCDHVDPVALRATIDPVAPSPATGGEDGKSGGVLPIGIAGAVFGSGMLVVAVIVRRHRAAAAAP